MRIQELIATIQTDKTNGAGEIPPAIMSAVTWLVSRLEGMLPDVAAACGVAQALGIEWRHDPSSATLAWAWIVWPCYEQGRLSDLQSAVLPLLPAGQPFGQSEIDAVHGALLLAAARDDAAEAEIARKVARRMRVHNCGLN